MKFSEHKKYRKAEDNLKDEDKKLTKYYKIKEYERDEEQPNNQYLKLLSKEINILKNEINTLKLKDKEKEKLMNNMILDIVNLKNSNQVLKDIISIDNKKIKKLIEENEKLKIKIEVLTPIVFGFKISKLLKKILEYIINDPDLSSGLININNKISFGRVPKVLFSLNFDIFYIIDSLNKILEIIFSYSSKCDCRIHFVKKEAINNINYRERIPVFNNHKDFFNFFGINELHRNILTKLIPLDLFISIDNYSFEEKTSSLLTKIK